MPLSSAQSPLPTSDDTSASSTYVASLTSFVGASGVVAEIQGSGSSVISITKLVIELSASDTITVTKQSANSSGGTSSTKTNVPLDSNNSASNATVLTYTVAPSAGAAVGDIAEVTGNSLTLSFGDNNKQPVVLNAAAEALSVSLGSGATVTGYIEWIEA